MTMSLVYIASLSGLVLWAARLVSPSFLPAVSPGFPQRFLGIRSPVPPVAGYQR